MAHERRDKREKAAIERAEALDKTVPKLELKIAESSGELQVFVNERQLTPAELAQPLRLDPGTYTVVAKAPGKADFQSEVQLTEGQTATLEIAALGDAPSTAAPTTTASAAPSSEPAAPADTGLKGRRTIAIALGAAGVVGLGVGTFFGLRAKSKLDESNESHCDANDACDPAGLDLRSNAQSAALISTIGFGAGVVLLGAGAFFWFTDQPASPTALQVAPVLSPVHAGLRVQRRF
jgi:hypothetical protein